MPIGNADRPSMSIIRSSGRSREVGMIKRMALAIFTAIALLSAPQTASAAKTIYVGNLDYNVTDEELRQAFEAYGEVISAAVTRDPGTGQSRGFGYVKMANDDEAEKAISGMNGQQLGARWITVNEARSDDKHAE